MAGDLMEDQELVLVAVSVAALAVAVRAVREVHQMDEVKAAQTADRLLAVQKTVAVVHRHQVEVEVTVLQTMEDAVVEKVVLLQADEICIEIIKNRASALFFLRCKKEFTLKKHSLAHTKKICLKCKLPIIKKYSGKTKTRTFFCQGCQVRYN